MSKQFAMKSSIIAIALMASIPAWASKDQSGGCQGNCPTTGGTSNVSNNNATAIGIGLGGQGGTGGQGGQGGAGGTAQANAQGGIGLGFGGAGGSVAHSGNSNNENRNANSNVNSAKQGQQQGQGQSQANRNTVRNDNHSSAEGGSATSYGSVATTANSVNVEGDNVTYQAARIPVATAYAPNIAPTAVCMGSTSIGGQGMSFGVSIGSSWTDANCMLLEQVRTVSVVLGQKDVAAEMMMAIPAYAEAVDRLKGKRAPAASTGAYQPQVVSSKVEYTDPIVRARLGLPPLK